MHRDFHDPMSEKDHLPAFLEVGSPVLRTVAAVKTERVLPLSGRTLGIIFFGLMIGASLSFVAGTLVGYRVKQEEERTAHIAQVARDTDASAMIPDAQASAPPTITPPVSAPSVLPPIPETPPEPDPPVPPAVKSLPLPPPPKPLARKESVLPFAVQVGAFRTEDQARAHLARLAKKDIAARLSAPSTDGWYRLRVGEFSSFREASVRARELTASRGVEAFPTHIHSTGADRR